MGTAKFETTYDYARRKANCRVFCLSCQRARIVTGLMMIEWFNPPVSIAVASARMRCSRCDGRGVRLAPVPA